MASNPWTKKNPFLSMWLSNANAITGAARGKAVAEMTRQMNEANKTAIETATRMFWNPWMPPPAKSTRRRKK